MTDEGQLDENDVRDMYYLLNNLFVDKILEGRKNEEFYEGFFRHTLRYQMGVFKWQEAIHNTQDKAFCTPSDEAFAIVNIINLRDYWKKKWTNTLGPDDKPLYTKKKGTQRINEG